MVLRIDTIHYIAILKEFQQKIWDDELTEAQQKRTEGQHQKIWGLKENGKNGYNFFDYYFVNHYSGKIARNYFIRRIDDYADDFETPIKAVFLKEILLAIGIKYPIGTTPSEVRNDKKKASKLYNQYKRGAK